MRHGFARCVRRVAKLMEGGAGVVVPARSWVAGSIRRRCGARTPALAALHVPVRVRVHRMQRGRLHAWPEGGRRQSLG